MVKKDILVEEWFHALHATPVVLVSTVSKQGVSNVAPYGMNMPISHNPGMIAIGVVKTRDTYRNILDTGEFVVNQPTPELLNQLAVTARAFPPDVSEFDKAGLTPLPGKKVKAPRVAECPAHIECKLEWYRKAGDHDMIVGRVVAVSVNEELVGASVNETRRNYETLYHIGDHYYGRGRLIGVAG